jgi:hypothetical protein
MDDPDTHAVFVATRHDLHAELVVRALRAGKARVRREALVHHAATSWRQIRRRPWTSLGDRSARC